MQCGHDELIAIHAARGRLGQRLDWIRCLSVAPVAGTGDASAAMVRSIERAQRDMCFNMPRSRVRVLQSRMLCLGELTQPSDECGQRSTPRVGSWRLMLYNMICLKRRLVGWGEGGGGGVGSAPGIFCSSGEVVGKVPPSSLTTCLAPSCRYRARLHSRNPSRLCQVNPTNAPALALRQRQLQP